MGEQLLLLVIQTPRCCQDGPIALCGHISLLFFLSPFSYTSSLKQTTKELNSEKTETELWKSYCMSVQCWLLWAELSEELPWVAYKT